MALLQLAGMTAFILASVVLGMKLLLLWSRTRESAELGVGLSFLVGGGLGYTAFLGLFVVAQQGDLALARVLALAGLACSCFGALLMGAGAKGIYRPAARWPWLYMVPIAGGMFWGWGEVFRTPAGTPTDAFWWTITPAALIYVWVGVEGWLLHSVLAKRARLGMADPVVVGRAFQWGLSCVFVFVMIGLGPLVRIVTGPGAEYPAWASFVQSLCGLATAGAIWLGFFPPAFYRGRLARAYGA